MLKSTNLLIITASLLIISCSGEKAVIESPVVSKTQLVLKTENERGNLRMVPYNHNMHGVSLNVDNHEQIMRTMYQAKLFVAENNLHPNSTHEKGGIGPLSWQEQDNLARSFLAKYDQDPYAFFYRQEVAQKMITHTDLLADPSEGAIATLEFYVNLMVDEGMYSPGLYFYTLTRLKNHWPKSRVKETVKKVLSESEKYATKDKATAFEYEKHAGTDKLSAEMVVYFEEVNRLNQLYAQRLQRL